MVIKKSGKTIFGAQFNAAEQKAIDMELNRQMAEHLRKTNVELESIVVKRLRDYVGFDEKQLREFFDMCDDDINRMIQYYELDDHDMAWLCTRQLKAEGIDVEQWYREKYPRE